MRAENLLNGLSVVEVRGLPLAADVGGITFDSRQVSQGTVYVAVKGTQVDGHSFIPQAVEGGARLIICEQLPATLDHRVTYVRVPDSAEALGFCASNFFGRPSSHLQLVGVTGTNGKTTTATLLYQVASRLGFKAGLLSTVRNLINGESIPSTHTTPDAVQINKLLARMVEAGCSYCFMEVTSHSVVQHRISGLVFRGAVFTNLTHDHLDYHKTIDAYFLAKRTFFDGLGDSAFALTNADDPYGARMIELTKAKVYTYGVSQASDFRVDLVKNSSAGLELKFGEVIAGSKLIGRFNAYNLTAAYGASILLGFSAQDVLAEIPHLNPVAGRFDIVSGASGITGIIDFAHTPDALQNVLQTIRELRGAEQRIITVVGCGGDRDREKRPLMARIAYEMSDKTILTSDNPRSEDPHNILAEMAAGLQSSQLENVVIEVDRKQAIIAARQFANRSDILLVAGKGHEEYQERLGVRHPFSDKDELERALQD